MIIKFKGFFILLFLLIILTGCITAPKDYKFWYTEYGKKNYKSPPVNVDLRKYVSVQKRKNQG